MVMVFLTSIYITAEGARGGDGKGAAFIGLFVDGEERNSSRWLGEYQPMTVRSIH